jgi:hypothetical protein
MGVDVLMAKIDDEGNVTRGLVPPSDEGEKGKTAAENAAADAAAKAARAAQDADIVDSDARLRALANPVVETAKTPSRVAAAQSVKDAGPPYEAPAGTHWTWVGNEYKLYKDIAPAGTPAVASGGGTTTITTSTGDSQAVKDLQKQLADLKTANATQTALAQANQQQQQQNAITMLTQTFINYGLSADIAAAVTNLVQQGYTSDTIQVMAQDPKGTNPLAVAFQQRFPANAQRLAAGLPVLSPAQYIANEQGYAQVMRAYGLNPSFATNKDVFTKLLTNDVSPTELNGRVNTAKQVIENTDPAVAQQLQAYYGLSQGDMIAHVLDPTIATPIIEKQISTSQIGAEAARYGANVGQSYATQLAGLGITQAQAGQGFQNIAQQLPGTQELATRYAGYTPAGQVGSALQAAQFGTTGAIQAQQELERLKTQEISQFSGSSGAGKGSLMGAEEGVS